MTEALLSNQSTPSRAAHVLSGAIIAIVCIATFYPLSGHDFIDWDDPHNLSENPRFNPPTFDTLAHYWSHTVGGLYVPAVYTAWFPLALIARHTGDDANALDPRVFHVANIVVHLMCAMAVYGLLNLLLRKWEHPRARHFTPVHVAALLGALVFAVHPVQVETVAWISGLKDLLCGLFSVLALWAYVKHATIGGSHKRLAFYLLATAAFALALLAKPVAVVVPLMAAALDAGLLRRRWPGIIGALVPWLLLALPVALVTREAQPIPVVYDISPWRVRPIVAGDVLAFYVRHILFPARLALDYGRSPDVIGGNPLHWLMWLVPIGVAVLLWLVRKRARPLVVGVVIGFTGVIPVLGFRPFGAQVYSSVTDHYLYLPMIGIALAAAWALSVLSLRVALRIAIPVFIVLSIHSWRQTWHWRDTVTLFTHNLTVNPRSWTAHINLAADALLQGDAKRAEHHARRALAIRPTDGLIYTNLGVALGMQSRYDEALQALQTAARLAPDDPSTRYWLAEALVVLGRVDQAEMHYRHALRLDPGYTNAQRGLARLDALRRGGPTKAPATQ